MLTVLDLLNKPIHYLNVTSKQAETIQKILTHMHRKILHKMRGKKKTKQNMLKKCKGLSFPSDQ